MRSNNETHRAKQPLMVRQDGRIWFTREAERRFYFILTLIMLAVGILYKTGVI